jgi:hypothetical protein
MPETRPRIGLHAFGACLWRSLRPPAGSPLRWNRNRALATFVLLPLCLLLALAHALGFLLDEIFFRGYRRVRIAAPVFVVGPPRCGTTFLHRVLARDRDRFTAFTLGEMVFAPSITEKKIYGLLGRLDALLGAPVARRIRAAESRGFEELSSMHWVSFFEPEEDYVLLAYLFANHLLIAMFPFPDLLGHLWRFDEETPPAQRERVLRFYRACVQRHLYHHGPDKTFLSKNPYFTPMIDSLDAAFPDARFVCSLRDPRAALPSMLGLWQAFYGFFGSDPDHHMARGFVIDFMADFYGRARDRLAALPPKRAAQVDYARLIAKPQAAIADLYARFGLEASPAYAAALAAEAAQAHRHKSAKSFDLARFGLDEAAVRARFGGVWDFPPQ